MPSALITIGKAGAAAARTALEVTGQNIANASNPDYARRAGKQVEIISQGTIAGYRAPAPAGVSVDRIGRSDDTYLLGIAHGNAAELGRVTAEVAGRERLETVLTGSALYERITGFEASLARMEGAPLDPALRSALLENARTLTDAFRISHRGLSDHATSIADRVGLEVEEVNRLAAELATINRGLMRSEAGTSGEAALLDGRDARVAKLSSLAGVSIGYGSRGVANLRLGAGAGTALVSGDQAASLLGVREADGSFTFSISGAVVGLGQGSLAGHSAASLEARAASDALDRVARALTTLVNDAQAAGVTPAGTAGQPLFAGSGAEDIHVVIPSADGVASAPAGAPPGSGDAANLAALRQALSQADGPAARADALLRDVSGSLANARITRTAIEALAEDSAARLASGRGVILDAEAANLIRFQQAFQASGRVIQAANTLFDTILAIR
jgi:flagellar hook-associated protein 1 FlgK